MPSINPSGRMLILTRMTSLLKTSPRILSLLLALILALPAPAKEFDYPAGGSRKSVGISTDVVSIGLPVAALGLIIAKEDWNGLLVASAEAAGVIGATCLLKETIHSSRPDHSDEHGMPSRHTATAFLTASYLTRRYGWELGVPAYALATYVGWGRIYSKRHDFWQVLAGAALGTATGLIFTSPFVEKSNVTITPEIVSTPSPLPQGSPDISFAIAIHLPF